MVRKLLSFTQHGEAMLVERNILRAWVEDTIAEPDEVMPDPSKFRAWRAFRTIPERDGRVLRVVYTESEGKIRIITAFFDRARRRRVTKGGD